LVCHFDILDIMQFAPNFHQALLSAKSFLPQHSADTQREMLPWVSQNCHATLWVKYPLFLFFYTSFNMLYIGSLCLATCHMFSEGHACMTDLQHLQQQHSRCGMLVQTWFCKLCVPMLLLYVNAGSVYIQDVLCLFKHDHASNVHSCCCHVPMLDLHTVCCKADSPSLQS